MEWGRKLSKNDVGIVTGKSLNSEKVRYPDESFFPSWALGRPAFSSKTCFADDSSFFFQ
jgi:hypothetical protein